MTKSSGLSNYLESLNHLPKPLQYLLVAGLGLVFIILTTLVVREYSGSGMSSGINAPLPTGQSANIQKPKATLTLYASDGDFMNELNKVKGIYNAKVGETFIVGVYLTGEGADAIDVSMTYDPQTLTYVSQEDGVLFPETIVSTQKNNEVRFSASTDPNKPSTHTNGYVVYAMFTPKVQTTSTQIGLNLDKNVVAQKGTNILNLAEPLTVSVE